MLFMNFWYAAELSEVVGDEPLKIRMLGQDFVLFRDETGKAHCLSNTCCHRGASLGNGIRADGCIQCPYHGWRFAGDGRCTKVPSLGPNGKIPARARVDSYPTKEKFGLIHVFLGDLPEEERPPMMEVPEYDKPGWRTTIQEYRWTIDYQRSVENSLDPAHNEYVHPTHGFSGGRDDYFVPDLIPEQTDWSIGFRTTFNSPPLKDEKMKKASGRSSNAVMTAGSWTNGPCNNVTKIDPMPEKHIYQYSYKTPIDETHSRNFLINVRNFMTEPENDERMMVRNDVVAGQDGQVLEKMNPLITPETNTKELFVPADKCISIYRDMLKQWIENGWCIDSKAVELSGHRVAWAIPSPARRKIKGWVIDAIPTVRNVDKCDI